VALILIITGGDDDDDNVTVADTPTTTPTLVKPQGAPATPPPAAPAPEPAPAPKPEPAKPAPAPEPEPAPKPAPAAKPATLKCEPIVGSGGGNAGQSYAVTSTATSGKPAPCSEARSVILDALNSGGGTVDGWQCKTDLSAATIATCKSGGKTTKAGS
jgi:outer membrane biosynthesis protein TonB